MIGGLKKSISCLAFAAAAGLMYPAGAMAADLGGNCCADLEERIAELEATTARKGNRRVSLVVSGHVNESIVFWDVSGTEPGAEEESGVSIGTNNASRSRFRFSGEALLNEDWSAGFLMEFGVRRNDLASVDQDNPSVTKNIDIRHEALYVKSKTFGTVWMGWTSAATDGVTEICLGCGLGNGPDFNDDFGSSMIAANGKTFQEHAGASGAFAGEGDRRDLVRYISPTFAGFAVSASYGGDDYWDLALRYAHEFNNSIRVGFGVGYSQDTDATSAAISGASCDGTSGESDRDCRSLGLSGSVMHVPTGLYIASAYGLNQDELATGGDTNWGWHITAGINRRFNTLGNTNFWLMYTYNEREISSDPSFADSSLDVYGVGVEQKIDAAAMEVYMWYKRMEAEENGADTGESDQLLIGSRIKF
ncbi:MAG: porin [Pseudomonadota bacterium]